MAKRLKRAFTITELVIVIAVVAILAAVLIPTFANIINKANESADTQTVTNINQILSAEEIVNGRPQSMYEAMQAVEEGGYKVENLTPTRDGYDMVWDEENNRFALLDENGKTVYSAGDVSQDKWKLWKIVDGIPENYAEEGYSYYAGPDFNETQATVSAGFDAGEKENIAVTLFVPEGTKKDVTVRTNGGAFMVNAPESEVAHYGTAASLSVQAVAENSYHEYGTVGSADILKGHFAVEAAGKVGSLVVPASAGGTVSIKNSGTVDYLNTIEADGVEIENRGTIALAVMGGNQNVTGNQAETVFNEVKTLTADTHEITTGGFYSGNGVTIESQGVSGAESAALIVNTHDEVVISGVVFKGVTGVCIGEFENASGEYHVTLLDCSIETKSRGVRLWYYDVEDHSGSSIDIRNCTFSNTTVTDYDTDTSSMTYGIIMNNADQTEVNIENTVMQGYGYAVMFNYHSDLPYVRNTNNVVNISGSTIKGRAAVDAIMTYNTEFNIENTLIRGINNFTGSSERFGNIVLESGSGNTINLTDTAFEIYRAPATSYNNQVAARIRSEGNTINLRGNNTVEGYIYYTSDATDIPQSPEDLENVIYLSPNCMVNGSFASAKATFIQGANQIVLDWNKISSGKTAFLYFGVNGEFGPDAYTEDDFETAVSDWFMNGEGIDLCSNAIVLKINCELSQMNAGGTFLINFNGYSITQRNQATIVIPAGVTVKTDSAVSVKQLFSAKAGSALKENFVDGHYEYTAE